MLEPVPVFDTARHGTQPDEADEDAGVAGGGVTVLEGGYFFDKQSMEPGLA